MSENEKMSLINPASVSKEVVKSVFNLELASENYQKLLQEAENIVFTKENINQDYTALKKLREIRKKLDESREEKKKPFTAAGKAIQDAYNELDKPIKDVLDRKTAEFTKVNDEIKAENLRIEQENQKKFNIQQSIQEFVNNTTIDITKAETDTEIIRIQKAVGSEKSRSGYYGEFLDQLKVSCDNLTPLINERKAFIRERAELEEKEKQALSNNDHNEMVKIKEAKELLEFSVNENAIRMQETAFEQAVNIVPVVVGEMAEVVAPRRSSWKWRVDDITSLYKKMPHLVELTPNKTKIDELLATKKAEGSLKGIDELKIFGLTLYLEKLY